MDENKKSLFTEDELLERKQESQHEELTDLLRQVVDASREQGQTKEIARAIQNNAGQLGKFVESFKNIKFDLPAPQVNVAPPQVNVDVKQDEIVKAIGGMFQEMKAFLVEVKSATEQLSVDVKALNETNQKQREMFVTWNYGRVEKITVTIKK